MFSMSVIIIGTKNISDLSCWDNNTVIQSAITWLTLTLEALEQGVRYAES